MAKWSLSIVSILLFTLASGPTAPARAARLAPELTAGYSGGFGGQAGLAITDFISHSRLGLLFSIGYSSHAAGNAEDARRIFINDATNGTPEKGAHLYIWRLDFTQPLSDDIRSGWSLHGGPRYSRYSANFAYIGGNEDFDVRSHQWGLGGGLEYLAPMSATMDFRIGGGADYFLPATLEGHDTAYSPDGDDVNTRNDYEYKDADEAISQPKVEFRAMVGVRWHPRQR